MVLHLSEQLDVPLRDRNHLLLAAGFAPAFEERAIDAPEMAPVREALRGFWADAEGWVRGVIADGQRDGKLVASVDARVGAETLLAGLEGAMVSARLFQDRSRMNDAINCLLAMIGCERPGSAMRAELEPRRRRTSTSPLHRSGGAWS